MKGGREKRGSSECRQAAEHELETDLDVVGQHRGVGNEPWQPRPKFRSISILEALDHFQLLLANQSDVQHLADHHINRFGRKPCHRVCLNDSDAITVEILREKRSGGSHQRWISFHTPDMCGRLGGKPGQHAGAATQFQDIPASRHRFANGLAKWHHSRLIPQHVEVIMQWNKLTEHHLFGYISGGIRHRGLTSDMMPVPNLRMPRAGMLAQALVSHKSIDEPVTSD